MGLFYGFPQSLQASAGIVPFILRHDHFLPRPFPFWRQRLTLSIGFNWGGSTWSQRHNPVSDTLCLKKHRTMENAQNWDSYIRFFRKLVWKWIEYMWLVIESIERLLWTLRRGFRFHINWKCVDKLVYLSKNIFCRIFKLHFLSAQHRGLCWQHRHINWKFWNKLSFL